MTAFLNETQRRAVFTKVLAVVDAKFAPPQRTIPDGRTLRKDYEPSALRSATAEDFEGTVTRMLRELGVSHTGFFHDSTPRAAARIAIAATFTTMQRRTVPAGCFRMCTRAASRRGRGFNLGTCC